MTAIDESVDLLRELSVRDDLSDAEDHLSDIRGRERLFSEHSAVSQVIIFDTFCSYSYQIDLMNAFDYRSDIERLLLSVY